MTYIPTQTSFDTSGAATNEPVGPVKLTEYYWGWDIGPGETMVGLPEVFRMVTLLCMVGAGVSVLAVWLMPTIVFDTDVLATKLVLSLAFLLLAVLSGSYGLRGTQVRLRFDRRTGELFEVVGKASGGDVVLAQHCVDSVTSVDVVMSEREAGRAQVQVSLENGTLLPAGDGNLASARFVQARLITDFGLSTAPAAAPEPNWSRP